MSNFQIKSPTKIYDHEAEGDFEQRADAKRVAELPGRILDPDVARRITRQRHEYEDDESGRVFLRWKDLSPKQRAVLAAVVTAVTLPVFSTLNNITTGEGLVKRAHQLEHIFVAGKKP